MLLWRFTICREEEEDLEEKKGDEAVELLLLILFNLLISLWLYK